MEQADLNHIMRLRNQLVFAAETFRKEENSSLEQISTMSKEMDQLLKLAQRVVDVADRANINFLVTLLRYNVDRPGCSNAQVRILAREREDEKSQKVVYVKYKFQELIHLLDVMIKILLLDPFVLSF